MCLTPFSRMKAANREMMLGSLPFWSHTTARVVRIGYILAIKQLTVFLVGRTGKSIVEDQEQDISPTVMILSSMGCCCSPGCDAVRAPRFVGQMCKIVPLNLIFARLNWFWHSLNGLPSFPSIRLNLFICDYALKVLSTINMDG